MPVKEWRVHQLIESKSVHGDSWIPVSQYCTLDDAINWCSSRFDPCKAWAVDYGLDGEDWHFRLFNEVTKEIIPWEAL